MEHFEFTERAKKQLKKLKEEEGHRAYEELMQDIKEKIDLSLQNPQEYIEEYQYKINDSLENQTKSQLGAKVKNIEFIGENYLDVLLENEFYFALSNPEVIDIKELNRKVLKFKKLNIIKEGTYNFSIVLEDEEEKKYIIRFEGFFVGFIG